MIYRQTGQTSAQAMLAIKARHGDDVIVISTHETPQGVEVVFTAEGALDASPAPGVLPQATGEAAFKPFSSLAAAAGLKSEGLHGVKLSDGGSATSADADSVARRTAKAGQEMAQWLTDDPVRASTWQTLCASGLSPDVCRALMAELPSTPRAEVSLRQALEALQLQLQARCMPQEIIDRGGVYALVGPTGAGKTTTVAKLAVRCLAARGKGSVCIVTTDTYRIGAIDQLKIYGRVLGVNVHVAANADALRKVIEDNAGVHLILIDTMGLSPRDARIAALVKGFDDLGVKKLLVLSAASQPGVQRDVIARFAGQGLSGCVLSKLDEASEIGGTLDAVLRNALDIAYVSVGQRVPEDLHRVDPVYLAWQALPAAMSESFRLEAWMQRWQRWGLLPAPDSAAMPAASDATL